MNDTLPTSRVAPARRFQLAYTFPLLALLFAAWLAATVWLDRGPLIRVHADLGYGIRAGDALRYRGIQVGSVVEAQLARDLGGVSLSVRLDEDAEELARSGSRFWIVRPHVALDNLQGLETIVGARYLSVLPGPIDGEEQREFVALAEPPVLETVAPDGLEIVLEAAARLVSPGAAVTYRKMRVGTVLSVGLASDATGVEARVYIRPPFVQLVRADTRFWETGGIELDLGLTGLSAEIESIRALLVGGVALATPTEPGTAVGTGHRFRLHTGSQDDWLKWRPALAVGNTLVGVDTPLPAPVRAQLTWRAGLLRQKVRRRGWLLAVDDGLFGPANLLRAPSDAREGSVVLECEGERFEPKALTSESGELGVAPFAGELPVAWPKARTRIPSRVEDCLLVVDASTAPRAVDAARIELSDGRWRVDRAIAIDEDWHGAAVVARSDGTLIGVLIVEKGRASIAHPP